MYWQDPGDNIEKSYVCESNDFAISVHEKSFSKKRKISETLYK